ncbi:MULTISPECIES: MFS transporter [unclassified Ensifer]|uniref:MFS transporter n=1 Tax=unclassified Ensifer TaxID=2633371 RepID=UPI000813BDBD|nr:MULTISPECIES: MFS transporter [unclassified Ensifer]OCP06347.1 MFS transporter [Ensifer sp. LC11]OCP09106.1 MFS transporter [Ensifer sp. LC13]OCP09889.1 MFS transporter [Ensifer sp. LC14]OCP31604.1 MFS transporter [Ensifer sp. LC499]
MTSTIAALRGFGPVFALLFGLQFISMGAMEMSGPFWPIQIQQLGPSSVFGLASIGVYVCPMLGVSLTSAFWGRMGDRYGNRLMMVRALAGLAITQALVAFAQDVWTILALRFLQGACAGYIAPAQAYGVQVTGGRDRAALFAWLQMATNVGSLGGALLGGFILDALPFAAINLTAGMVCAICAAVAWASLPVPPREPESVDCARPTAAAQATTIRMSVPGLLLLIGLLLASRMVLQVPFSLYMAEVYGAQHWIAGLSYGLLAFGFVVGAPVWARIFEGRAPSFVLGWSVLIAAGCLAATGLAGSTRIIGLFAALYFTWGMLLGGTTPVLLALVSTATRGDRQGSILGLAQSCQQGASIVGIIVGVVATQRFGLAVAFPLVAALYGLSCLVALGLWLHSRRSLDKGELS